MMKTAFCYVLLWCVVINSSAVLTSLAINNTYGSNKNPINVEKSTSITNTSEKHDLEPHKNILHTESGTIVVNNIIHQNKSVLMNNSSDKSPDKKEKKINTSTIQIPSNTAKLPETYISTTTRIIPVKEGVIESTGDSRITARKGVSIEQYSATTQNPPDFDGALAEKPTVKKPIAHVTSVTSSTVKPRKKKPTATIGSEDEPYPSSNFVAHKHLNNDHLVHSAGSHSKLQMEDEIVNIIGHKRNKSPDYVLPIVLTILAVPLIAIIMAVVYKRGSEWWQHRHYRRMDFLIDGMYNN